MEALDVFGSVISSCWGMLAFPLPGIPATGQDLVIALLIIKIVLSASSGSFGLGGSGTGYRSGSGGKRNISEKRKGDEK